jgi:hypothetical protein
MGGMGGYGGGLGGMGFGGYMGMPGYFSGLGAMGSYMPMMQRSYPSYSNPYPALSPPTQYQPHDPNRKYAYGSGTSTGGKGLQTGPQTNPGLTPVAPPTNPNLRPVTPPRSKGPDTGEYPPIVEPVVRDPSLDPGMSDDWHKMWGYAGPAPKPQPQEPELADRWAPEQPQEPQLVLPEQDLFVEPPPRYPVPNGFDPLAGGGLLGGMTMPDMTLPGGRTELFVPGGPIPTGAQQQTAASQSPASSQGGLSSLLRKARETDQVNSSKGARFDNDASMIE